MDIFNYRDVLIGILAQHGEILITDEALDGDLPIGINITYDLKRCGTLIQPIYKEKNVQVLSSK